MRIKITVALSGLLLLIAASCSNNTVHDLVYMENLGEAGVIQASPVPAVTIVPGDELAITVSSEVPGAAARFSMPFTSEYKENDLEVRGTERQQTYLVDKQGDIDFPIMGRIHVEGMTTNAIREKIREFVAKTVKEPRVNVRLVNFKVNVLGEVKEPGIVKSSNERMTLFEALADRGDLTEYAKRETVTVMRETADGSMAYQRLNLRDSTIVNSPFFQLRQNDVVYVAPNEVKQENAKLKEDRSYKMSVVSAIVSSVSVISSLIIALTVK